MFCGNKCISDSRCVKFYKNYKHSENLVESMEDFGESYGFQYKTERGSVVVNRVERGN